MQTIEVTVAGGRRRFTLQPFTVRQALEHVSIRERAWLAAQAALGESSSEARAAQVYLEAIAPVVVALLSTPADEGEGLKLSEFWELDSRDVPRVLAAQQDLVKVRDLIITSQAMLMEAAPAPATIPDLPESHEITVVVAGETRRFYIGRIILVHALNYLRAQEAIADAMRTACADIVDRAESVALSAELYLHGVGPLLTEVILATPADSRPTLTLEDVWTMEPDAPLRIQAEFESITGIGSLADKALELLHVARQKAKVR